MASYTDSTPQFRPYVQQLPVQAMVEVGMMKQNQYDQGVQRIQSQIDKVAGLSVMRDVDKQYLQSKMNELGNNLRMVSMGDFSNYQLVNSVGGMVNQVGQDEKIQNAVISTARLREEKQKMDAAQKAGKSSVNREYDFNRTIEDYLNNPEVGASFSGKYKEHIDVNKKVLDVISKLHPNVKIQDIAYGYNPDGSINTRDILDAMHRQGITEVNENQIRTAVNSVLDENDYDELASAGRYHFRGYGEPELRKITLQNYMLTRKEYQTNLDNVQKDLLTATNPDQILQLNEALRYYQNLLGDDKTKGKLDERQVELERAISTNPDAVRAELYTRNYLDQIANGFSYREVKDEVLTSPIRQQQNWILNYNLSLIKEQNEQAQRKISNEFRERELNQQLLIAGMKAGTSTGKPDPKNPNSWGEGWITSGDATTSNLTSLENFKDDQRSKEAEAKQLLDEIARTQYTNSKFTLNADGVLRLIDKYKNGVGTGRYVPDNPSTREAFDRYIKLTAAIANNNEFLKRNEDVATKQETGGLTFTEKLSKDLANVNPLAFSVPGRGVIEFSPKEVYDFIGKEEFYSQVQGGGTLTIPLNSLTEREKLLYGAIKKRYEGKDALGRFSTGDPKVDAYLDSMKSIAGQNKDLYNRIQRRLSENLADVTGIYGTQARAIEFTKDTDKQMLADQVSILVNKDAVSKSGSYNFENAANLLKDNAKGAAFAVITKGDSYAIRITSQSNPSEYEDIPVTASYIRSNPYLGNKYLHENVDMAKQLLLGHGSTNPYGAKNDYTHSYYMKGDFGREDGKGNRTVTLPVAADLQGGVGDGTLFGVIKLKTNKGDVIFINGQKPQNIQDWEEKLKLLTDSDIISMFKNAGYTNIEQLIN